MKSTLKTSGKDMEHLLQGEHEARCFSSYKTKLLEASHEVHAITGDSYDTNAFPIIPHMLFLMASFAPVWYIACIYNLATSDLTKLESKIFKKKE